jgi:hypothetical protein
MGYPRWMPSLTKWLAVIPALAVFALLVGGIRAGGTPNQAPAQASAVPVGARDAWDIPVAKARELPADMVALGDLPAHQPPMSEADFKLSVERRSALPATKALVAFVPDSYAAYLEENARLNRLRFTRYWYSRAVEPAVAADLLNATTPVVLACTEHTWAFAREFTVSFELGQKVSNVASDGPQALTECFANQLPKALSINKKTKQPTKITASFVVMKS